ncbi:hypothetical protein SIN8267_02849 [Sinobacterium norvegicum]|uniref:Uncharacterized protein n=1 Tax=Sinobacterium norvegicum TaxID=1641715 RepID=A0ABM9AIW2_9GAMM|nr:hypothetical protein [Sinobacterium norvegicum]CAH0992716.1 hypothetical protein SIN8267_02849 [Sinobacterium norvegicum]
MTDIHINDFYKDCGLILLALYQHFPRPFTLYVEDISGPDSIDQYGLHSERHQSCLGAMLWLEEEGFIRYQQVEKQESIDGARLSQKALSRLTQAIPVEKQADGESCDEQTPTSVVNYRRSRIHHLRAALEQRDSFAIGQITRQLIL